MCVCVASCNRCLTCTSLRGGGARSWPAAQHYYPVASEIQTNHMLGPLRGRSCDTNDHVDADARWVSVRCS